MKKNLLIATGVVAAALMAAPAYAESGRGHDGEEFEVNLGSIVREFHKDKRDERKDTRRDSATSTVSIKGTVTAVNGTVISLSGKDAAAYTIQAANASFENGSLADIRVGDTLKVKGTVSGTIVVATRIVDRDGARRAAEAKLRNLRAGIVTSVSGNAFTITRFGSGTTATVSTNASTTIKVNGKATTTAAITPGTAVVVVASSGTTTPDSVVGGVVHVITKGFGWLKHVLLR